MESFVTSAYTNLCVNLPEARTVVEPPEKQGRNQKIQGAEKCLGMTGILGTIVKYHSRDSWLQKFFKNLKRGGGRP